jgi:DNA-3-methyladenine glycosylase
MPSTEIRLKRVYEPASADDGMRILVERLWPRGLTKANVAVDHWVKDVAPTAELRSWYGHRPARWREFQTLYRLELDENRSAVSSLRELCAGKRVTFIFAAKDIHRNSAVVLKEYLETDFDRREKD